MTITLTAGATTLALDPDLLWDDEFAWAATEQSFTRSLTGKPIIQAALRQAGRPITLRGVAYLVVFRHHDGGPFEARPLVHYADPQPADWVLATLRFMTVTE